MAGYSATPLLKKLGIKPGFHVLILNAPAKYWEWISPLPEGVRVMNKTSTTGIDFVHLFASGQKELKMEFVKRRKSLRKDGAMWISWPKKSSAMSSDLDENVIRDFGLKSGMVDVKVCAIDDTWSGLKFVFRLKDR